MRFKLARPGARDPHLRGDARPAYVRVVLDVLGRGDIYGQAGRRLEPIRLVQELLVAGRSGRPPLDVEVMRARTEHPPLAGARLLGDRLGRSGLATVAGAALGPGPSLGCVEPPGGTPPGA